MAPARRTEGDKKASTSALPGPSGPEGGANATQGLPAGRNFTPKGPYQKRRFGSFAAVGKGTRRRSGGILLFVFFPMMERTKDHRGLAPRSASTPVACPRTPLRGTLPGWVFLASGAGGTADCFPFRAAAAGWAIQRRPSQLDDENAPGACSRRGWYVIGGRRNAAPTQGPGPGCRGGLWPPVVYRQTKQHGISQAAPVGAADPNLHRARAQWPGRRSRGHSSFARREEFPAKGPHQNGVLVPLPPWAKEPAAGAAESSFSCSFQ